MSTAWAWLSVARFPAVSARAWKQLWRSKERTSPSSVTSTCLRMEHLWVATKSKLRREMERVWCYTMLYHVLPTKKTRRRSALISILDGVKQSTCSILLPAKAQEYRQGDHLNQRRDLKGSWMLQTEKKDHCFQWSCPIVQVDLSCSSLWILMTYNESCAVAQQVLDRELLRTDVCSTWNQGGSPFVDVILMI